MNFSIEIESIIDDSFDLIVTKDPNGINTGIFLIRNSEWSINFLEEVWKLGELPRYQNSPFAEQVFYYFSNKITLFNLKEKEKN